MSLNVDIAFPDSNVTGLAVRQYILEDELNGVYELRLDVLSADPDLDLSKLIGHPITVTLKDEPYLSKIHGLVRLVRQVSAEAEGDSKYEILVVPPLWLASRSADHRIFQDTTADEVCTQILSLYGAARVSPPAVLALPGRPKQEYRVQYGETDLGFMLRALAEEGLIAYFHHTEAKSDWTIIEDTAFTDDGAPKVRFVPPSGTGGGIDEPHVSSVALTAGMETTMVTVRDYDFKKPQYVLEASAETSQPLFHHEDPLERYEFLDNKFSTATEKQGQALAKRYLEEARAERRVLECRTSFALAAGGRFTVQEHPRSDVNAQLLVVRARCSVTEGEGGKPVKLNLLTCIPAADPWRPRRLPKPRIHGTHLAFVVGNQAGVDEIDVDEHGRVKIEFRWDRRDLHEGKPTRFVRVSASWAGLDYGMVLLPRVNEEVIVGYLDGDPDEPMIIGRLHNAFNASPLKLPAQKTQSIWKSKTSPGGGGYNEIMMEDKKGQELLRVHAHRDNLVTVGGNQTVNIGSNQSITVGANQTLEVGADQKIHVKGVREDHVDGSVTENFDTSLTTTISGPQSTKAAAVTENYASLDTTVKGVHHEKFGSMGLEGGNVHWNVGELGWLSGRLDWTLKGPGHIKAPSFVIDSPEFRVTNAGSHTENKGSWATTYGAKVEAGVYKFSFTAVEDKVVPSETKVYGRSINIGVGKIDVLAVKVDFFATKLTNNGTKLQKMGADIKTMGVGAYVAGIFSLA